MSAFFARAARGDRPAQAGRGPGARGERDSAAGCSLSTSLFLSPKGRTRRLQRRALSHLRSPCSRPSRRLSGPPSHVSSPFPYPYSVIGMVIIGFVGGSHVRQTWEGRHLDPPERHLGKPEAPVEERHTGSLLLLLRFLRSCGAP